MKQAVLITLAILLSCLTPAAATDAAAHTYTAEVAGVMCSACSDKIKTAFQTLPGVKSVQVKKSGKPAVARVEITSTSATLTKEAAVKSLGTSASSYDILTFHRTD